MMQNPSETRQAEQAPPPAPGNNDSLKPKAQSWNFTRVLEFAACLSVQNMNWRHGFDSGTRAPSHGRITEFETGACIKHHAAASLWDSLHLQPVDVQEESTLTK